MEPIRIVIEVHIPEEGTPHVHFLSDTTVKKPEEETIVVVRLDCERWINEIGKKPMKSCKGCTVTCPAKGKYQGQTMHLTPENKS